MFLPCISFKQGLAKILAKILFIQISANCLMKKRLLQNINGKLIYSSLCKNHFKKITSIENSGKIPIYQQLSQ